MSSTSTSTSTVTFIPTATLAPLSHFPSPSPSPSPFPSSSSSIYRRRLLTNSFCPHTQTPRGRKPQTSPPSYPHRTPTSTVPSSSPFMSIPSLSSSSSSQSPTTTASVKHINYYSLLNVESTATSPEIRRAYLNIAKKYHPDANIDPNGADLFQKKDTDNDEDVGDFDQISKAYRVLIDPETRKLYDAVGIEGLVAIETLRNRAAAMGSDRRSTTTTVAAAARRRGNTQEAEIDYWGNELGGDPFLLSAQQGDDDSLVEPTPSTEDYQGHSAYPNSPQEAIQNLEHPDKGFRYFAAWWISKNRVKEAQDKLIQVLRTSQDRTALGGYSLRRRVALALGNIASVKAIQPLAEALDSDDYHLRYRAAEALARIAYVHGNQVFVDTVKGKIADIVHKGAQKLSTNNIKVVKEEADQEALFDLSNLEPEVQAKLRAIFAKRKQDERASKRKTHTPNLGVVAEDFDEPYEWLIKTLGFLNLQSSKDDIAAFLDHKLPLTKYAACKAMYQLTGDEQYPQRIAEALAFGAEHHYSQRVFIRDLGDVGYLRGVHAIEQCAMVENSFKILALRHILERNNYQIEKEPIRDVFASIDALL